jgi:protein-disulfide isomerase
VEPAPHSRPPAERSRRRLRRDAAAIAAMAAASVLIAAGCGGGSGSESSGAPTTTAGATTSAPKAAPAVVEALATSARHVRGQLRGIAQHGLVLGDPKAPVTIVEYGSFACPQCAGLHESVLEKVIQRYVRTGRASLEFRGVAPAAPSQELSLALASYAASAQRHGWDFLQLAYRRSLERGVAGQDAESPARLAAALGLDNRRFGADLEKPAWKVQVAAARSVAAVGRFQTYPVFLLRARATPGEPFVVLTRPSTLDEFDSAITRAAQHGGG